MVSPAVGKVILVPFPFSDLSQSNLRQLESGNRTIRTLIRIKIKCSQQGGPHP